MKAVKLAWLAGIFDGEGTITTTKNNGTTRPLLQVTNTNQPLLTEVQTLLNELVKRPVRACLQQRGKLSVKPCYYLYVTKQSEVKLVLEALIPYLIGKREQAVLLLEYVNIRLKRREDNPHQSAPYEKREDFLSTRIKEISRYEGNRKSVESGGVNNLVTTG